MTLLDSIRDDLLLVDFLETVVVTRDVANAATGDSARPGATWTSYTVQANVAKIDKSRDIVDGMWMTFYNVVKFTFINPGAEFRTGDLVTYAGAQYRVLDASAQHERQWWQLRCRKEDS